MWLVLTVHLFFKPYSASGQKNGPLRALLTGSLNLPILDV